MTEIRAPESLGPWSLKPVLWLTPMSVRMETDKLQGGGRSGRSGWLRI